MYKLESVLQYKTHEIHKRELAVLCTLLSRTDHRVKIKENEIKKVRQILRPCLITKKTLEHEIVLNMFDGIYNFFYSILIHFCILSNSTAHSNDFLKTKDKLMH